MQTRKYPRTLNEAFGPYCDSKIYTKDRFSWTPVRLALAAVYAAAIVVLFVVLPRGSA